MYDHYESIFTIEYGQCIIHIATAFRINAENQKTPQVVDVISIVIEVVRFQQFSGSGTWLTWPRWDLMEYVQYAVAGQKIRSRVNDSRDVTKRVHEGRVPLSVPVISHAHLTLTLQFLTAQF
jgi:hypothetical protein